MQVIEKIEFMVERMVSKDFTRKQTLVGKCVKLQVYKKLQ
jgi:hypothetical protein